MEFNDFSYDELKKLNREQLSFYREILIALSRRCLNISTHIRPTKSPKQLVDEKDTQGITELMLASAVSDVGKEAIKLIQEATNLLGEAHEQKNK